MAHFNLKNKYYNIRVHKYWTETLKRLVMLSRTLLFEADTIEI